jgi:hypothetical protein
MNNNMDYGTFRQQYWRLKSNFKFLNQDQGKQIIQEAFECSILKQWTLPDFNIFHDILMPILSNQQFSVILCSLVSEPTLRNLAFNDKEI